MYVTTINLIHTRLRDGTPMSHPVLDAPSMMTAPTRKDAVAIAHRILDKLEEDGYGKIVQDVMGTDPVQTIVFQFNTDKYYVWSIAEVKDV